MSVEQSLIKFSSQKLRQLEERIETCVGKMTDDQLWSRAGENSNAAGNLCLHLAGNVRQWIIHGVGGAPDVRQRDSEFNAQGGLGKDELLLKLKGTLEEALAVIGGQKDLLRVIRPQTYEVTVLEAVYHVVEHFAQHTAQILYATKGFTGEDLGFYAHLKSPLQPKDPTP